MKSRLVARAFCQATEIWTASPREPAVGSVLPLSGDSDNAASSGTKDSDEPRVRQKLMKLLADRVGALAFRAGQSAHQKNHGNAVGVRTRRQPGIYFCGREIPGIDSLAAQQSHEQLGRKIIGR